MLIALPENDLELNVASALLNDPVTAKRYASDVEPAMFRNTEARWLVSQFKDHYERYRCIPDEDALSLRLKTAIDDGSILSDQVDAIALVYERLAQTARQPQTASMLPLLQDAATGWMQKQALTNFLDKTLRQVEQGRVDFEAMSKEINRINTIGSDHDAGAPRFLKAEDPEFREHFQFVAGGLMVGTSITEVDNIIGGGVEVGGLGCVMAPSGKGKSQLLIQIAAAAADKGLNVLHVSLELSLKRTWARYQAWIRNVNSRDILDRVERGELAPSQQLTGLSGEIQIRVLPSRTPFPVFVKACEEALDQMVRRGVPCDLLIVDYADEITWPKTSSRWEGEGEVFASLRGKAGEWKIPCWTATQTNRGGNNKEGLELGDIGTSWQKVVPLDLLLAFETNSEKDMIRPDQTLVKMRALKVRSGEAGHPIDVVMNPQTSRFYIDTSVGRTPAMAAAMAAAAGGQ